MIPSPFVKEKESNPISIISLTLGSIPIVSKSTIVAMNSFGS
jgi:hypothetical protein